MLIGDTLPVGYDGPIPDVGPMPDFGVYDGPAIDLGAFPDATPPVIDTGVQQFMGADCTEFRQNPQACNEGGGICMQGTDNPNRWYCTLSCVTQNQATCTNALAGSCCVADGQGIQGHCRIPADCP
jgi:hypothetical protein